MSDLEKRTLVELRKMAKELGIPAISGLKKRELIEKIEQSSEVQKNDSVPRSAASDFSHRNFDEKTEAPQEHTEREKQFFEELGEGILEVLPDGYGFLRAENCLPGANDVYVSPAQIRRFNLKTGDRVMGNVRPAREGEKVGGLVYVQTVNGDAPYLAIHRPNFEELTPIYPEEKLKLETALELGERIANYEEISLFRVLEQYGSRWGAARLARYLTARRGLVAMWTDYLGELEKLGEADDESRVFPKDLTEAHAQTSARLRYRHDRETAEKVLAAAEKLRKRYTFRACGLLLEPFETPEEIVREGTMQHICIGSYVERYAGGGTILCKLRLAAEPDKPWHAVEFTTGGAMVQCRGEHNQSAEEDLPVLERFWAAWDQARKTKTELHVLVRRKERAAV